MITIADSQTSGLGQLSKMGLPVLCGAAAFLTPFSFSMVGQIPVGELVLLLVMPFVALAFVRQHGWPALIQQTNWFRLLLILLAVTLVGYIGSDIYRNTTGGNLARGWARVIFLGLDLVSVTFLIDGYWSRLWAFVLGGALGRVAQALVIGPLFGEYWKFGFGQPVTIAVLFLLGVLGPRKTWLQVLVCLSLGGVHLALGARSMGGFCVATAALLAVRQTRGIVRPISIVVGVVFVVGLLWIAQSTVAEDQNHSGSNTERQSMIETASDLFIDSPLIGQGSWFITRHLTQLEAKRREIDDSFSRYSDEAADQLAIHSQLLVALAEGGILGGVFFFGYGGLLIRSLKSALTYPLPQRPLVIWLLADALWNLAMSPFSGEARVWIAMAVAICLMIFQKDRGLVEEGAYDE